MLIFERYREVWDFWLVRSQCTGPIFRHAGIFGTQGRTLAFKCYQCYLKQTNLHDYSNRRNRKIKHGNQRERQCRAQTTKSAENLIILIGSPQLVVSVVANREIVRDTDDRRGC
jgi:hypothetical protein